MRKINVNVGVSNWIMGGRRESSLINDDIKRSGLIALRSPGQAWFMCEIKCELGCRFNSQELALGTVHGRVIC